MQLVLAHRSFVNYNHRTKYRAYSRSNPQLRCRVGWDTLVPRHCDQFMPRLHRVLHSSHVKKHHSEWIHTQRLTFDCRFRLHAPPGGDYGAPVRYKRRLLNSMKPSGIL